MISGSSALAFHGVNLGEAKDLDALCTKDMINSYENCDIIIVPKEIYDLLYNETGYITPNLILTIKMSHLSWDIKWEKTKRHINILLSLGFIPDVEVYSKLKTYWETVYGNKAQLSLDKNKIEFFNDHVTYVEDHDYLHELVSFPMSPMYTECLKENEEVLICYNKFTLLSHSDKVRLFKEEITVIAIERWLINPINKGKFTWSQAWNLSLKKVIISLTKNWATDFIIHNLKEFSIPDYSYFKNALIQLKVNIDMDLTVFEEMLSEEEMLNELIYLMCEGDYDCDGYEHLEQEGGGEGGAEYCYGVFKLHDKIYKAEYCYSSSYGCYYEYIVDTLREVKPVQKMITVYA